MTIKPLAKILPFSFCLEKCNFCYDELKFNNLLSASWSNFSRLWAHTLYFCRKYNFLIAFFFLTFVCLTLRWIAGGSSSSSEVVLLSHSSCSANISLKVLMLVHRGRIHARDSSLSPLTSISACCATSLLPLVGMVLGARSVSWRVERLGALMFAETLTPWWGVKCVTGLGKPVSGWDFVYQRRSKLLVSEAGKMFCLFKSFNINFYMLQII